MDARLSTFICLFRMASVATSTFCRPIDASDLQLGLRELADDLLSTSNRHFERVRSALRIIPVSVLIIHRNTKTHDLQLCQVLPLNFKETGAHSSYLRTAVSRPADHRPHSFPIQWLLIWCSHSIDSPSSKELRASVERHIICGVALPEAHLPLPRAGLLRLLASRLLSGPEVDFGCQNCKLHSTWSRYCTSCWTGLRTVRLSSADPAGAEPTLSLFARLMPCILGAKCVGDVLIYGSSAHHP